MQVVLGADEDAPLVRALRTHLEKRGDQVTLLGRAAGEAEDWGATAVRAAERVAGGQADYGVLCCWTGTGVSIAANKVPGVRAALCSDAETARGARRWNDANVLCLSIRATSEAIGREILEAFLAEGYGQSEAASLAAIRERERGA
jgi:ribose 5-phosphate isomerase B